MSAYTTQADIQGQIQLSDIIACTDDDNTGDVNIVILNTVIAAASGKIDQKVGNVYQIPFNPVPPSVASMALTITCYMLYRRRLVPDERNNFTEDYREVMAFLERVQKREDVLDLSTTQDFSQVAVNSRRSIYGGGNWVTNSM